MPLRPPSSPTELAAFFAFAAIAVLGALGTVAARNPIRAAVGLFFHILALAALYVTLGAHFLGVIQLLVYAGAVVVLFVFVIMLLGPASETQRDQRGVLWRVLGGLSAAAVGLLIIPQVGFLRGAMGVRLGEYGTLKTLGTFIFREAVIPFEMVGVALVIAVVAAFAIARGQHKRPGLGASAAASGSAAGSTAAKATEEHS